MAAAAALRHEAFVGRQRALAGPVREEAERRRAQQGYPPPYWVLVGIARQQLALPEGARP
jgi:hypothetical protein